MASNPTISIGFKIEDAGKDGFKNLVIDAKAFGEMMKKNVVEADKLQKRIVRFGQVTQGIDSIVVVATAGVIKLVQMVKTKPSA